MTNELLAAQIRNHLYLRVRKKKHKPIIGLQKFSQISPPMPKPLLPHNRPRLTGGHIHIATGMIDAHTNLMSMNPQAIRHQLLLLTFLNCPEISKDKKSEVRSRWSPSSRPVFRESLIDAAIFLGDSNRDDRSRHRTTHK
jgi:hypothetical protein